jgi:hypothetical protein
MLCVYLSCHILPHIEPILFWQHGDYARLAAKYYNVKYKLLQTASRQLRIEVGWFRVQVMYKDNLRIKEQSC